MQCRRQIKRDYSAQNAWVQMFTQKFTWSNLFGGYFRVLVVGHENLDLTKICRYTVLPEARGNLASSPGFLLKNGGRREPGNIRGKSCRLPPPWSGGTNRNKTMCTRAFCPLSKRSSTRKWTCKRRLHLEGGWKTVFGCVEEVQVQRIQDQSLL